ncbi:unnamed protein product [Mesocestoides corti]|uniref:Rubicon Homology domain-containing protein n=1 Tax=Mesocestoides corti TaxID=53468 RepID=A0A0R3UJC8_MESCO|nr:unnamed protein product [Mesocestoides corti]
MLCKKSLTGGQINCQRLFKSLDCICDGCGTSERGDVEDDFENESPDPCQTALIAGGLVRVLARDFFDHNATPPLRLQRLRVRLASMSDTDWVAALSEVTCQYHRRTGDHLNLSSSYFDMTTSLSSQRQTHGVKSDPLLPTTVSPSPYRLLPSTNSGQRQLPVGVENFFRSASTEWRSENDYGVGRLTSKRLIISPIIPKEKRKGILLSQENHCFGCGVYVETSSETLLTLDKLPPHWIVSAKTWSLSDLVALASTPEGSRAGMSECLRAALEECATHLFKCMRCRARGQICELCHKGRLLFPLLGQSETKVCPDCGACFHRDCFLRMARQHEPSQNFCPRCIRLCKHRETI